MCDLVMHAKASLLKDSVVFFFFKLLLYTSYVPRPVYLKDNARVDQA